LGETLAIELKMRRDGEHLRNQEECIYRPSM